MPVTSAALICDVVATRLLFSASPAHANVPHGDVVSNIPFQTQPLVQAQDDGSIVDIHFADQVTLSTAAAGQLTGTTRIAAIDGVARFTDVAYRASADQESFQLTADDEIGGAEGDLPPVSLLAALTCDVVAAQIAFATLPADPGAANGDVVNGKIFATQPILEARDAQGIRDTNYQTGSVSLAVQSGSVSLAVQSGSITLTGTKSRTWSSGQVAFTNLSVDANADGASFTLSAADNILTPVTSAALTCDIVATQIAFARLPADPDAVNGNVVNGMIFATQPILEARNAQGIRDTDYQTGSASLAVQSGSVSLAGTKSQTWSSGQIAFTNLSVDANADGASFTLSAADNALTPATSAALTCDVVATRLLFSASPAHASVPHGDVFSSIPFQTQPLVQAQDNSSIVDIHFADQVTLSTAAAGQLTGTTRIAAIDGVARFTDVAYRASADPESFQLTADDETGGAEGDLPPLILSTTTADVVATRAVFITQPAQTGLPDGTVVHALPFDIQPVLEAQDSSGVRDRHLNAGGVFLSVSSGEATLTGQAAEAWNAGRADFFGNGLTLRVTGDSERVVLEAESDIGLSATFGDPLSVDIRATRLVFLQGPRTVGTAAAELVDASIQVAAVYQDGRVDEEFVNPITVTAVLPGTDTPASGALTIAPAQVQIPIDGLATFSSVIYQEAGSIQLRAASPGVEVARSDTIRLTGNLTLDTPSSQLENQLAHSRGIVPARLPLVALEATAADEQLVLHRLEVVLELGNGLQLAHIGGLQLWRDRGASRILDDADQLLAVALVGESLVTFTAVGDTLSNTGRYLITWDGRVALQKDWTIRGRVHPEGMTVSSTQAPAITAVPVFGTTISGPLHAVGDLGLPHRVRLSAAPDTLTADGLSRSTLTATIVDALDQPVVYDAASIVSFATLNGSALIDGPVAVQVENGRATTALLAGTSPGLVQIRAGVLDLLADTLNIALVAGSVASIELGAVPSVLHLNQTDRIDLSATLRDARGNPVAHSPERIRLSISGSGFFAENLPSQIVDIAVLNGVARTTIEATQPGTLQVQASIDGISADLAIPVISTQPPHIILNADILSIPADGSGPARLTASLLDSRGQLMAAADSVQVSFSIGSGHGLFLTPSIVPARQGRASIDVQALGIAGPIIVRAEAPDLEAAELTLSARAAAAHHLDLVALTPGITADGLSTTLLSAVVRDTLNNLVTDADVEILFSIIDGRAEIIGPLTVPALEGIGRTTLRASIRAGSVELLATAAGLLPGRTSVKLLAGKAAKLALSAIPP